jgi:hypothetical protein
MSGHLVNSRPGRGGEASLHEHPSETDLSEIGLTSWIVSRTATRAVVRPAHGIQSGYASAQFDVSRAHVRACLVASIRDSDRLVPTIIPTPCGD